MNIRRRVRREAAFTAGRCRSREKRDRKKPKVLEPEDEWRAIDGELPHGQIRPVALGIQDARSRTATSAGCS
jgi:hypothetical protein